MEYLIGALLPVSLFAAFYGGYKMGQKAHKPKKDEVDEETLNKAKKIRKGFEQLMSYDVNKALQKKVE